jgi:phospholipid/cholesterol/gamma-HCH transport system substrate-binding protein
MRINRDVLRPANSTAKLGQTSLLGSMHIELAPPTDEPPVGELKNGSVIPLSHASMYPTTEQTLASVSILLTGGGIGQLEEINRRSPSIRRPRERHAQPAEPARRVHRRHERPTDDIIAAAENLNSLAGQIAAKDPASTRLDDRAQSWRY